MLITTNPVDVMTHLAARYAVPFGVPSSRVIGSGTTLDTARFRALLGHKLGIDSQHIHAYVLGEHGDSEVLAWSLVTVGGIPIGEYCTQHSLEICESDRELIDDQVRTAAYHIIQGKGASYYGIGSAVARLVEVILRDQRSILTVCTPEKLVANIADVTVSLPRLLGGQRGMGIDLYRTITIGDNVESIANAIRDSMQRAEIVITTGGLGPTVDDPTREAVARALGVEIEYREDLWQQVVATIARYGRTPTENQKRQAYVPRSAVVIQNPVGTAPAFIVEFPSPLTPLPKGEEPVVKGIIISLPGVPKEMEHLLRESVVPYLQERFDLNRIIKVRLLHTSGVGEGMIDDQIGEFEKLTNPTVGLAAHNGVVDIRIAAKAETESAADEMIAKVEAEIRTLLGETIFGADDDTLENVTLAAVEKRRWTAASGPSGLRRATCRSRRRETSR